ncbi:mitochondrial calcium uniporter regulator 1 [Notolabrus celidotus]|uniref:mitochondrial calcium uniporter regulator 1 n=1 Tax=Notolabrus celidotus TaxID=1203425 RepID=UPI00148FBF42|nr:mitochondrial calcium uniporter regulator 1 [Notolabrus celidotus]
MVLKQSHARFKLLSVRSPEKWFDPSFNHDSSSVSRSTVTAAVNTSPCSRCVISPYSTFEKPTWRKRGAHELRMGQISMRDLSTSIRSLQYDLKTGASPEASRLMFDTHAVVRLFEENGFTTQQAEVMVKVLMRMTNSNMEVIYSDMVTKVQQEIMLQRLMSQIASVKKDMIILEKSEFSTLLSENEKLKLQLLQLKVQLADIMNKVRSDTILDMNLEKSRVKELKADHERKLLETRTDIMEMNAEQERYLTQTNMKIDTEVAGLKTMLESHKLDTIKYLAGSVFTCLTVVLGFYRIWM